jgi:hypothetical protein
MDVALQDDARPLPMYAPFDRKVAERLPGDPAGSAGIGILTLGRVRKIAAVSSHVVRLAGMIGSGRPLTVVVAILPVWSATRLRIEDASATMAVHGGSSAD